MAEFYKLLFDLSLYWTFSGFFLRLIARQAPSAAGFLTLCAAAALDALLRARPQMPRLVRYVPLLLPLPAALARPGLWQCLHLLPAWAYLVFACVTGRIHPRYDSFREQFGFGLKLLPLLLLGLLFPHELRDALIRTVPYLVLLFTCGVCLLRMLREARPAGLRQGLYMGAFVLLCAGLTLGRAPQMLLNVAGLLYRNVLAPLIFVLAIALAVLFYGFYLLMKWLVARAQGSGEPLHISLSDTAEMLGLEKQYAAYARDLTWLKWLLIALAAAAGGFVLYRLFRRLLGERGKPGEPLAHPGEAAPLSPGALREKAPGRIRPRDARLAVRYYFAKFLAEAQKRGLVPVRGETLAELCARAAPFFPGADVAALADVYAPARYQLSRHVTQADVRAAADAWNALKHCPAPAVGGVSQKKRKSP